MKFNNNTRIQFGNILGIGLHKDDIDYCMFSYIDYDFIAGRRKVALITLNSGNRLTKPVETNISYYDIKIIKKLFLSDLKSESFKIFKVYKNYKTIR